MRDLSRITLCSLIFYPLPFIAQAEGQVQGVHSARSTAESFEGFAIQGAVGYQPFVINGNDIRISNTRYKLPDQNYYGSSTPYFVGLSYTAAISHSVTLGAQIELNPINQQYVFSVLPGYAVTPDLQGYLKLAWVNALVTVNSGLNQDKFSMTTNGMTAGLGVKQLLSENWYGFVEANYVKMNTFKFSGAIYNMPLNGNADYSGFNIMIGAGYKF